MADLKRLGIDAECVSGQYGELSVLVDDDPVITAGPLGFIGVLPSVKSIREAVERKLAGSSRAEPADSAREG